MEGLGATPNVDYRRAYGGENGSETQYDDALTLMATDLEVGVRYELRGIDVGRAGAAVLPIARLGSILRASDGYGRPK